MSSTAFGPGIAGGVPLARPILDTEEVSRVICWLCVFVRCREEGMLLAVPTTSAAGTPRTYQVKNKKFRGPAGPGIKGAKADGSSTVPGGAGQSLRGSGEEGE